MDYKQDIELRCEIIKLFNNYQQHASCKETIAKLAEMLGISKNTNLMLYCRLREGKYAECGFDDLPAALCKKGTNKGAIIVFVENAGRYLLFDNVDRYEEFLNDPNLAFAVDYMFYQLLLENEPKKLVMYSWADDDIVEELKKHAKRIFNATAISYFDNYVGLDHLVVDVASASEGSRDELFYKFISDSDVAKVRGKHLALPAKNIDPSGHQYYLIALECGGGQVGATRSKEKIIESLISVVENKPAPNIETNTVYLGDICSSIEDAKKITAGLALTAKWISENPPRHLETANRYYARYMRDSNLYVPEKMFYNAVISASVIHVVPICSARAYDESITFVRV